MAIILNGFGVCTMDERDWQIISLLYKNKNITKTANNLYISQPALTGRIKQIEQDLGVPILNRSNRGVEFTPHGVFVAEFANHLLGEISNFRENLGGLGKDVAGVIKIGATSIIGRYYLPGLLDCFNKKYPLVKFNISIHPSSELLKMLRSDLIDFGIVKHCKGFEGEEKRLLTTYNIVVANSFPFEMKDLPDMRQISYPYEEQYRELLKIWWKENFNRPPKVTSRVANLDLCKEMVFNGLGFSILPEILIPESPIPLYTKDMHHKDGSPFERKTWLACKKSLLAQSLPKLFFDFVTTSDFNSFLRSRNR